MGACNESPVGETSNRASGILLNRMSILLPQQCQRDIPPPDPEKDLLPSGLHELNIQSDGDFVANQNAARFERSVPSQAEVPAIDLGDR